MLRGIDFLREAAEAETELEPVRAACCSPVPEGPGARGAGARGGAARAAVLPGVRQGALRARPLPGARRRPPLPRCGARGPRRPPSPACSCPPGGPRALGPPSQGAGGDTGGRSGPGQRRGCRVSFPAPSSRGVGADPFPARSSRIARPWTASPQDEESASGGTPGLCLPTGLLGTPPRGLAPPARPPRAACRSPAEPESACLAAGCRPRLAPAARGFRSDARAQGAAGAALLRRGLLVRCIKC